MSDVIASPVTDGVSADTAAEVDTETTGGTAKVPGTPIKKDPKNSADKKAAPPAPPKRYKIGDFEGDENALKSEIERGRQANKLLTEAQKRSEKAAQIEKAEAARKDKLRKDLFTTLTKEYGLTREEALEQMAQAIYQHEIVPSQESPEKRAIRERDAQIAEFKAKEQARADAEKKAKYDADVAKASKQLYDDVSKLLESKKIPRTRQFMFRVAHYLNAYQDSDTEIPTERAADLAMEDFREEVGSLLDDSSPEQIQELLGKERWNKLAHKISNWALAQVKGGRLPKGKEPDTIEPKVQKGPKKYSPNDVLKEVFGNGVF